MQRSMRQPIKARAPLLTWLNFNPINKCLIKLLIHFDTSAVQPLQVISINCFTWPASISCDWPLPFMRWRTNQWMSRNGHQGRFNRNTIVLLQLQIWKVYLMVAIFTNFNQLIDNYGRVHIKTLAAINSLTATTCHHATPLIGHKMPWGVSIMQSSINMHQWCHLRSIPIPVQHYDRHEVCMIYSFI